jgi:hypothetical protein
MEPELVTELQNGFVNFFVCLLNSFEQLPVPGVTENRYLAYAEQWGWLCEGGNLVLKRLRIVHLYYYIYYSCIRILTSARDLDSHVSFGI